MKYLIIILLFISIVACDSDDNDCTGIDCLPPITQTGAGTFGCLINGEPFVDTSGRFNCFYQFVDGDYYFGIGSDDELFPISQIIILSWMKEIQLNTDIPLNERANGNFFSEVSFDCFCPNAVTTSEIDGFIRFSEYNANLNILSATFEFTVIDPTTGTIYEVREGRFDSQFTQ